MTGPKPTHPPTPAVPGTPIKPPPPPPTKFLRAVADYLALTIAIGRVTSLLLVDVARDIRTARRARREYAGRLL